MATSLVDFVRKLVNDEALWAKMRKQPQQVMADSGLSPADRELMRRGPVEELEAKLIAEGLDPTFSSVIIW